MLRRAEPAPHDVRAELERTRGRRDAIGRRVYWLESAGSTNDVAEHLARLGAEEGTTVVAETQTEGRGRQGRSWFSPPGAGLYFSIILRPAGSLVRDDHPVALLTLASGVAVADAIRDVTGLPVDIKWPNDINLSGRKLAGILAEAATHGGEIEFVVLGIGVNLQPAAYPAALANRATSIAAETSKPADRALVLAEILAALGERYADLRAGRFDAILSAWRSLAPSLPGAQVEWDSPSGVIRGRAEGIDDRGALLARAGDTLERLVAGEVRFL